MKPDLTLKQVAREVGLAIRHPEDLVLRWRDIDGGAANLLIAVLLLNAVFGTAAYGVTMQMHRGPLAMLQSGVLTTLAAGGAWLIALPALYIVYSALGSPISPRSSVLTASITVCFGAWAMLASVPINWFFGLALPFPSVRLAINVVIFTGVGLCMTDVFVRTLQTLDPDRPRQLAVLWVCLLGVIGSELFVLFGVFTF